MVTQKLSYLLLLVAVLFFTACGSNNDSNDSTDDEDSEETVVSIRTDKDSDDPAKSIEDAMAETRKALQGRWRS